MAKNSGEDTGKEASDGLIVWISGFEPDAFPDNHHPAESDGQGWKEVVKHDGEGKLQAG